jgi:hypothetical protein
VFFGVKIKMVAEAELMDISTNGSLAHYVHTRFGVA